MRLDDALWEQQPFLRRSGDPAWYVRFLDRDGNPAQSQAERSRVIAFHSAQQQLAAGWLVIGIVGPQNAQIPWTAFREWPRFRAEDNSWSRADGSQV